MAMQMTSRCTCPAASRPQAVPRAPWALPARPSSAAPAAWRRQPSCSRNIVAQAAATEVAASPAELPPEAGTPPSMQGLADTYAVIDIGGVQHIVEEGRWYTCNRLEAEPGSTIRLGRVLAHKSGGKFAVGQPYLTDINVEARILDELKGPKIVVFKHKPKKHYTRKTGHRQPLSKFLITKIDAGSA